MGATENAGLHAKVVAYNAYSGNLPTVGSATVPTLCKRDATVAVCKTQTVQLPSVNARRSVTYNLSYGAPSLRAA